MTDPVVRDLNRHLAQIDADDALDLHIEAMIEEDPEHFEGMSEAALREIAERDIEDRIAEQKIDAYLDSRYE